MSKFNNICIVVGTRPEIIKTASLVHELNDRGANFFIVHSNQHYSPELDAVFFEELDLPKPKYNLQIGSGQHGNQVGRILIKIEPILEAEKPDLVLVQGDTNTVLAAGLAATKLGIKLGHIEAGLRSYDRTMPEELNRIAVDHLADYLFSVTCKQTEILLSEGINKAKIFEVGNTVIDTLYKFKNGNLKSDILTTLNLREDEKYILLTAHRASNVDSSTAAQTLVNAINKMAETFRMRVVFPVHPRSKSAFERYGLSFNEQVQIIEPLRYSDFTTLLAKASIVVTDSGGIQEEACALQVPCVTIRENTERPETVTIGANILVGANTERLIAAVDKMLAASRDWVCPYGDGNSAKKIVDCIVGADKVEKDDIVVVGMGYMGLPMACILADVGHDVHGVDIDESKINKLNAGQNVIQETGFDELFAYCVAEKSISFSTALKPAPNYIISVPTPHKDESCDLSYVKAALSSVLTVAPEHSLIIIESTIKPRTCVDILQPMIEAVGKNILLAHCPERAIPGNTLYELRYNDRIVGGTNEKATQAAAKLYETFCKGIVFKTDSTTAECAKLMENTFRDVNIAIANEFDEVLYRYGVSAKEAINLANKHPRVNILSPGVGVGGHCIAVDPWFLIEDSETGELIRLSRHINESRPALVAQRLAKASTKYGRKIGLLGYAYKPNVDDARETPVEGLKSALENLGYEVRVHDPFFKSTAKQKFRDWDEINGWSDVMFVAMEHSVFGTYTSNKPILRLSDL